MKSKAPSKKASGVGPKITARLTEFAEALETGKPLDPKRFTLRTVAQIPSPGEYDAKKIRAIRHRLKVSQSVFALLLGVSPKLVQNLEQTNRQPTGPIRRLLDQMDRQPELWTGMIRSAG